VTITKIYRPSNFDQSRTKIRYAFHDDRNVYGYIDYKLYHILLLANCRALHFASSLTY